MVGQLETLFEIAGSDAAVQERALDAIFLLAARDVQGVAFGDDVDLFTREAGQCHHDAVFIFRHQFDVVRRIARLRIGALFVE
ncbi:hypothetical protein D3C81_1705670 [compost metagenome]